MAQTAFLLTDEELDKRVDERVERRFEAFLKQFEQKPPEEVYDSRSYTCSRLGVSMPTLDDLVKRGVIPAYRVGARILFKRSEVDAALVQIKSDKHFKHNKA